MSRLARRGRLSRPWGYAIDYPKAIAEDELYLAAAEAAIAYGWIAPDAHEWELADLVFSDLRVRAELNLSLSNLADLAFYREFDRAWELYPDLPNPGPGAFQRGRAINDRLKSYAPDLLFASVELAEKARKRWKTALARHRRNAERNS